MKSVRQNFFVWGFSILVLVLVSLPYVFAARSAGSDYVFGGFLLNPLDGNSYLAKMTQGWDGGWQFHLTYSSESGEGVYLFLFYIFLGHVARIMSWSLVFTFHFFRILGAGLLLVSLYRFCKVVFAEDRTRMLAFSLSALGSGVGWLAILFGGFTSDFWVVEAYPFLSAYATPHFAIGLALQLWLLTLIIPNEKNWKFGVQIAMAALLLAIIDPFGVPVVLVVWGGVTLWKILQKEAYISEVFRLAYITLGGGLVLLYDFWVINTHPALSGWNAQNVTPSPQIWDLLISLGVALIFALPGALLAWRSREHTFKMLLSWAGLCLVLLYVPFNLQRRFLSGFFVPIACLAALGVEHLAQANLSRYRRLAVLVIVLAVPTNLIVLATSFFGAATLDLAVYLTQGEVSAFEWIDTNTPAEALVLAGPESGLFLPAYTHARVLYGHPFETLNAVAQEAAVTNFFSTDQSQEQAAGFLSENDVDFIFVGPRELSMGDVSWLADWPPVYQAGGVSIYAVGD
ncbi:MAG: hypothetical protein FVQ83_09430 [Chloroflexi bacterium]|nr:hypothetical protein [Chloroflexota bacterium]